MEQISQRRMVSVIIPNYNYARFLDERIESILNQSFQDFELILLDDASTDDSKVIFRHYEHSSHITHICINSVNSGSPFVQWEKGFQLATGKYIWIAESDDLSDLLFLEKMVALMERDEGISVCFSGSILIDDNGQALVQDEDLWGKNKSKNNDGYAIFGGIDYIKHNLYWKNYIYNASAVLFRKDCLSGMMNSSCFKMRFCGDWLFWVEIASQGKVAEVYQKLNQFRQHEQSTTARARVSGQNIIEDMDVVKQIERKIPNLGCYRKMLRRGIFYKKIKRIEGCRSMKKRLYGGLKESLGGDVGSYLAERFNKNLSFIFPWILTASRDRM